MEVDALDSGQLADRGDQLAVAPQLVALPEEVGYRRRHLSDESCILGPNPDTATRASIAKSVR